MYFFIAIALLPLVLTKPFEEFDKLSSKNKSDDILLVTFDGEPTTTFAFKQMNDPVMVK